MEKSITVSVDRQHAGLALKLLREQTADNSPERNALNRAALSLESLNWQYSFDTLAIQSATFSKRRYHVTPEGCDCPAGRALRPCHHAAALAILMVAEMIAHDGADPQELPDFSYVARSLRLHRPQPKPGRTYSDDEYAALLAETDLWFG